MSHIVGPSVAAPPAAATRSNPDLSPRTREFCRRHGLDATTLPVYLASNLDRPVDILRLTAEQLDLIPAGERPDTVPELNGIDHLVFVVA